MDLLSNPTDTDSTKVKFTFKMSDGVNETPRKVVEWFHNVQQAFAGLNCTTGTLGKQMLQKFVRGSALSSFNAAAIPLATAAQTKAARQAQAAANADNGNDAARANGLTATLATVQGMDNDTALRVNVVGEAIVVGALHELATWLPFCYPTKSHNLSSIA